jgi:hypothetical protein
MDNNNKNKNVSVSLPIDKQPARLMHINRVLVALKCPREVMEIVAGIRLRWENAARR